MATAQGKEQVETEDSRLLALSLEEAAATRARQETASEAFKEAALTLLDSQAVAELRRLQQETCAGRPAKLESVSLVAQAG